MFAYDCFAPKPATLARPFYNSNAMFGDWRVLAWRRLHAEVRRDSDFDSVRRPGLAIDLNQTPNPFNKPT
jgi:hypothetical protein